MSDKNRIPYDELEELFITPADLQERFNEAESTLKKAHQLFIDARVRLEQARLNLVKALKPGATINILFEDDPVEFVGYDPAGIIIYKAYGEEKERAVSWFIGFVKRL